MKLAAIYIEDHEYLFQEPQTINFGGKYFYEFSNNDNIITVKRTENEKFIPDFFSITSLQCKVTNLTAIVGQNGAGKSTLLDIIRSNFIENEYALPQSKALFLVEIEGYHPVVLKNDFEKVLLNDVKPKKNKTNELTTELPFRPQTIYYSPHYDYKYNLNFDEVDSHDISFDKIVDEDLKYFEKKDTNEKGWPNSVSQELLFKNSLRQINFLSSDLVQAQIFQDLYELQGHYQPILRFRGYRQEKKYWNTPYSLRIIIDKIEEKVSSEIDNWHTIREFEGDKVINQLQVNKYILKRHVISCILSLIRHQMERKNIYLHEVSFPYEEFKEQIERATAYETFLIFVKHCAITREPSTTIFNETELKSLLEKIYEAIEKAENENAISNESLKTSTEDAIEILNLQRLFLNELNSYYVKLYSNRDELLKREGEKIEEFINYMPFSRRMSSGEGALLNFYSRLYDFLNSNLREMKYKEPSCHYILLLDEADLTFHITWKKKYIKALLSTLPHFFNKLENKPTIEIIFSTHDPIILSDLPNSNVIYIERPNYASPSNILDFSNNRRPLKTFGANISDLIADSFFNDESLIGNFVFDKIQETIKWLNNRDNIENQDYFKKLIKSIDEPIIQRKLAEMYDDKMKDNFQADIIDEQIKMLQELKSKLVK